MAAPARERRLLFWNVRQSDLMHLVVPLVRLEGVDVVVLNEPPTDCEALEVLREEVDDAFHEPPAGPASRFRCLSRD